MSGYKILSVVTVTASASPGTPLASLIPEPQDPEAGVDVLLKSCASDVELVDPNVDVNEGVAWAAKTAGGGDRPVGTYRLASLRRYSLVGSGQVVFTIMQGGS